MKKTLKGFTLIEMLIVIVIIGILAAVLIPKIGGAREKAQDVAVKANVRSFSQGLLTYQLDGGTVSTFTGIADLNTPANAQQYNFNYVADAGDTYSLKTDGNKFIICGKLDSGEGGNSSSGAADLVVSSRNEGSEGAYYCYKG